MTAPFVVAEAFPAELSTPGAARHFVVEALRTAGVPESETVPVAVSELVTNSVLHAASTHEGGGRGRPGRSCGSRCTTPTSPCPMPRHPGPDTVTGRGLLLVEALTDRWGAERTGGGKVVWFELDR